MFTVRERACIIFWGAVVTTSQKFSASRTNKNSISSLTFEAPTCDLAAFAKLNENEFARESRRSFECNGEIHHGYFNNPGNI